MNKNLSWSKADEQWLALTLGTTCSHPGLRDIAYLEIDWCLESHGLGHAGKCSGTQSFVFLVSIAQQAVDCTIVVIGIRP